MCAFGATGVLAASAVLLEMRSAADDIQDRREPVRQHPAPGTPFWFEVIESFNAKYQGDTAGHIVRGGGLSLQPHVALGDSVHHRIGDVDTVVAAGRWLRLPEREQRSRRGRRVARSGSGRPADPCLGGAFAAVSGRGHGSPANVVAGDAMDDEAIRAVFPQKKPVA